MHHTISNDVEVYNNYKTILSFLSLISIKTEIYFFVFCPKFETYISIYPKCYRENIYQDNNK